jgi:truncated hemoglobin YjbI
VAVFEKTVAKLNNKTTGFIDLFWPGVMLVEHKREGQDLALAHDYFLKLKDGEHPRYLLTCDFQHF